MEKKEKDKYYHLPPILGDSNTASKTVNELEKEEREAGSMELPILPKKEKFKLNQVISTGINFIIRKCTEPSNMVN
jgi:hypothetical protein